MSSVSTKSHIGLEDINWGTGTFIRRTSSGGSITLNKVGGYIDVRCFGTVGDGVTDDTTAIQTAIDYLESVGGGILYFPKGIYATTASLTISISQITFRGAGKFESLLYNTSDSNTIIYVYNASGLSGFAIRDMMLLGSPSRSGGNGLYLRYVANYEIDHVYMRDCWNSLVLANCHSGVVNDLIIDEITDGKSNDGVTLTGQTVTGEGTSSITNSFRNVHIVSNHYGFYINGAIDTLFMKNCSVQTSTKCDIGFLFLNTLTAVHDPRWIRLKNCTTECSSKGYYFANGIDVELDGCYSAWGDYGIHLNGTGIKGFKVRGGVFQLHNHDGILVDAADDFSIKEASITDNNQHNHAGLNGITIAAAISNFRIINNRIGNNNLAGLLATNPGHQKYGINVVTGASDKYIVALNDLNNNETGGFLDGGTGTVKIIWGNIPHASYDPMRAQSIYPNADDTFYLGQVTTPYQAWKALILHDTTDGKHYKIETINGTVTATALD